MSRPARGMERAVVREGDVRRGENGNNRSQQWTSQHLSRVEAVLQDGKALFTKRQGIFSTSFVYCNACRREEKNRKQRSSRKELSIVP